MKKAIKFISILILGLITIACSKTVSDKPWTDGKSIQGDPLEIEISDKTIKEYEKKMAQGKALAEEAKDFDAFLDIYNDLQSFSSLCFQAECTNEVKYDVFAKEKDKEQYLAYSSLGNKVDQWFNEIEHLVAKNDFKSLFFEGMSDQQIQDYIGVELPQEYYDAQNNIDQLTADYYALDYDKNYYKNIDVLYKQLLESEKVIASYKGYDNYLEYCYPNVYGRDYSIDDTDTFFEYLYRYGVPAYQNYNAKADNRMAQLSDDELDFAYTLLYGDAFTECFNYIEDYKDYYGGFLKEGFDGLFCKNGHYNISYEDGGMSGAYQNSFSYNGSRYNYVYFGPGYHDAITVVHEFGHYLADLVNPYSYISYDFAETQSQADEFLFLQYIRQSDAYDFSKNFGEFIVDYYIANDISSMFTCAAVNEAEKIIYSQDTYELGDLEKAVRSIYEKYPALDDMYGLDSMIKYCTDVTMYSPGYYISYATSILGALGVNKVASTDFAKAKELYEKIINPNGHFDYVEGYKYVGLGDPFAEDTFKYIFG